MSNIVGGQIIWNLDVDKSKFDDGMKSASNTAKNTGGQVDNSMKSMSKSISESFDKSVDASNKLVIGLGAIITAGTLTATKFVQLAADTEMMRTNIDIMAGSVENGSKLYKELYDFAAKTPFETTDLVQATQTMLGYGISVQDATKDLKVLGDISLGNKNKLQGITYAFAQIMSTGRLTGQDLRQLINNGFNPLSIMSKTTGKSMSDLKTEMEDGAISADMVREAFYNATKEGGLFYQGMEKGSKTFTGVWSTMMDEINTFIRGMVGISRTGDVIKGSFFDKLKGVIVEFTKIIKENFQTIKNTMSDVVDWAIQNFPILAGIIFGALIPAFIGLGASIWGALAPLLPFILIGVILALAIDAIIKQLGGWENAQKKIGEVWNELVKIYNTYFKPILDELWKSITNELLPALSELWRLLSPVIIPALKTLAIIIGGIVIGAILLFIGIVTLVIKIITGLVEAWNWSIRTIQDWARTIEDNVRMIWNAFTTLPSRIVNAMNRVFDSITRPFREAWGYIENITRQIREALDRINPFHRESPSLVDNVIAGVKEIKKQYAGLTSIQLPPISSQSPSISYQGEEGSFSSKDVTVNIGEVRNMQDIEMISREIGYRFSLI